ncbi:hypothetical protein CJU89_2469 [Yarrowia sp. B02]|nr:hypothetical protein CJU89_2469 [Yarrowia sp. B02]
MPITFLPLTSPVGKPYLPKRESVDTSDVATDGSFLPVVEPKSAHSDSDSEVSDLNDAPTQFRARTESS